MHSNRETTAWNGAETGKGVGTFRRQAVLLCELKKKLRACSFSVMKRPRTESRRSLGSAKKLRINVSYLLMSSCNVMDWRDASIAAKVPFGISPFGPAEEQCFEVDEARGQAG